MERAYTAADIDQMRNALSGVVMMGESYRGNERRNAIEDQLRAYIAAGTDPKELDEWARAELFRLADEQREMHRIMNEMARM